MNQWFVLLLFEVSSLFKPFKVKDQYFRCSVNVQLLLGKFVEFAFGTVPLVSCLKNLWWWKSRKTSVKLHLLRLFLNFWLLTNGLKIFEFIKTKIICFPFLESGVNFTISWFQALAFKNFNDGGLIINLNFFLEFDFYTIESSLNFLSQSKDHLEWSFLEHFLFIILILLSSPI